MDPDKIRENMQRLSRIGEPGSPGGPSNAPSGKAKPLWTPLRSGDLKAIEAERQKLDRIRNLPKSQKRSDGKTFTGPRGGRYRINSKGRKSYDVPGLDT